MTLSFPFLKASPKMPLGLKYSDKFFSIISLWKIGLTLLLKHSAFENGHTYESINLMIKNSINASKLQIIRQKKDCTSDGIHYIFSNFDNFLRL